MDKMYHAKIEKILIGKTIKGIVYDDFLIPDNDENKELSIDSNDIYILLSDGSKLKIWNSEWGGIIYETDV